MTEGPAIARGGDSIATRAGTWAQAVDSALAIGDLECAAGLVENVAETLEPDVLDASLDRLEGWLDRLRGQRSGHPWLVSGPVFARRLATLTGAPVRSR